jgi:hypothetical protein
MRDIAPFGLRIPADLKKQLEEGAKKNLRSLNAEMIVRLSDSFERRPLADYSDGDLVAELMNRYERGEIYIRLGRQLPEDKDGGVRR